MQAGYSPNPLIKKLGYKPGFRVAWVEAPAHYPELLGPLPEGTRLEAWPVKGEMDLIHFFTKEMDDLKRLFPELKAGLKWTGMLWVSWPKKASKVKTDLNGNVVRELILEGGLVDVKVCAVDAVWSGLKMMYRLEDRKG